MTTVLQSLATEYVPAEDRIRLRCHAAQGPAPTLWLTQRLLQRLLPPLWSWLQAQPAPEPQACSPADQGPHAHAVSASAPQLPAAESTAQSMATTQAQGCPEAAMLIACVHAKGRGPGRLELVLESPHGQTYRVQLHTVQLRQWMRIVYTQCQRAQWPVANQWPQWLLEEASAVSVPASRVLH